MKLHFYGATHMVLVHEKMMEFHFATTTLAWWSRCRSIQVAFNNKHYLKKLAGIRETSVETLVNQLLCHDFLHSFKKYCLSSYRSQTMC